MYVYASRFLYLAAGSRRDGRSLVKTPRQKGAAENIGVPQRRNSTGRRTIPDHKLAHSPIGGIGEDRFRSPSFALEVFPPQSFLRSDQLVPQGTQGQNPEVVSCHQVEDLHASCQSAQRPSMVSPHSLFYLGDVTWGISVRSRMTNNASTFIP